MYPMGVMDGGKDLFLALVVLWLAVVFIVEPIVWWFNRRRK